MNPNYHNPVAITFGAGALSTLPTLVAGRKTVLVTFPEAEETGLIKRIRGLLGDSLIAIEAGTVANPDIASLAPVYERFWKEHAKAELIVGAGGGSALDTAKTLMAGTSSGKFADLVQLLAAGAPFKPARVKPLIAVPTTAGTGSEVTPWATIWDRTPGAEKKYSLHLKETWPEAALVDPELAMSLPAAPTLAAGLDALSHALESIWNVNSNPISDMFAVSAAREVLSALPQLTQNPGSLALRRRMALAALKAGLAFSNTRTALAHAISYEMTLHHGLPHGVACSFTLPMVLGRALGADPIRDAVLAQVFDCPLRDAQKFLQGFFERLGVSTDFASYGVDNDDAGRIVASALDSERGRNFVRAKAPAPAASESAPGPAAGEAAESSAAS
jgi:phosphonate metabolism-associated iron-containing alcohol dehydrogenase